MILSRSNQYFNNMDKGKIIRFFIKLDHLAAWILLAVILLYAISGYGMTKGLIDYSLAQKLHFSWLAGVALIAFVIHTAYAIQLALKRWRIWNVFTKILLAMVYLAVIIFFVYVNSFYGQTKIIKTITPATNNQSIATTKEKVFTAQTLGAYNGKNGQPAYVAVDGIVYDLSTVFRNGNHVGYEAGQDLSVIFHSQHDSSLLNNFSVVGIYQP